MPRIGVVNNVILDVIHSTTEADLREALDQFKATAPSDNAVNAIERGIELAITKGGEVWIDDCLVEVERFSEILSDASQPREVLGGNAANCSTALSSSGADVVLGSVVRDDSRGHLLLKMLEDRGVSTANVEVRPAGALMTPVTFVLEVEGGDRALLNYGGDTRSFSLSESFSQEVPAMDALLVLGVHNMGGDIENVAKLMDHEVPVLTDSGDMGRHDLGIIRRLFASANVACFNEVELSDMIGHEVQPMEMPANVLKLADGWINLVCVHHSGGALISDGSDVWWSPAMKVRKVATRTGLGDTFMAGLALGMVECSFDPEGFEKALAMGNYLAYRKMTGN